MSTCTYNTVIPPRVIGSRTVEEISDPKTPSDDIAMLTAGIVRGDEKVFETFHERYFDRLYRFLLAATSGDESQARDALQEALLRVARHPRVFDDEDAFWCWLKTIARNAMRDGSRKQRRYFALLERFAVDRDPAESCGNHDDRTLVPLLHESMEELSQEDRDLIEAKYLQGAAVKELAIQLGSSDKAVESRLMRIRSQLRDHLLKKLRQS